MDDTEKELLALLRTLPDFASYPLPARWYKADPTLTPPSAVNTRDFIDSAYTIKCANEPKDLPPVLINQPQQGGKLIEAPPVEEIKAETLSRPFTLDEIPAVLPYLAELPVPEDK